MVGVAKDWGPKIAAYEVGARVNPALTERVNF